MGQLVPIARQKLLLAKKFYERGREHMCSSSALDRIIAVHHFHIAIEIFAKSALVHFGIRPDKDLNMPFEVLLNSLDKSEAFKERRWRVPFRQQLRSLANQRNDAQHDASPPSEEQLEASEFYVRRFLSQTMQEYFDLDFEDLSDLDFIDDERIKKLLALASQLMEMGRFAESIGSSKSAFWYASQPVLRELVPHKHFWRQDGRELQRMQEAIVDYVYEGQVAIGIVATGIDLKHFRAFNSMRVWVQASMGGHLHVDKTGDDHTRGQASETLRFVLDTVLRWQDLGFPITVAEHHWEGCDWTLELQEKWLAEDPPGEGDAS